MLNAEMKRTFLTSYALPSPVLCKDNPEMANKCVSSLEG